MRVLDTWRREIVDHRADNKQNGVDDVVRIHTCNVVTKFCKKKKHAHTEHKNRNKWTHADKQTERRRDCGTETASFQFSIYFPLFSFQSNYNSIHSFCPRKKNFKKTKTFSVSRAKSRTTHSTLRSQRVSAKERSRISLWIMRSLAIFRRTISFNLERKVERKNESTQR